MSDIVQLIRVLMALKGWNSLSTTPEKVTLEFDTAEDAPMIPTTEALLQNERVKELRREIIARQVGYWLLSDTPLAEAERMATADTDSFLVKVRDATVAALAGSGMEEAVEAAKDAWRKAGDIDGPDTSVSLAWYKALEAAAPLLLARPLQEIERLKVDYHTAVTSWAEETKARIAAEGALAQVTEDLGLQRVIRASQSAQLAQVTATNARLTEALGKYGRHDLDCLAAHTVHVRADCTCGLSALLAGGQ